MSRKDVTRIKTADTGKTYEFPSEDHPALYEVALVAHVLNSHGHTGSSCPAAAVVIHLEHQTMLDAGLVRQDKKKPAVEPKETAEDLLIRLLEHIGVYPTE